MMLTSQTKQLNALDHDSITAAIEGLAEIVPGPIENAADPSDAPALFIVEEPSAGTRYLVYEPNRTNMWREHLHAHSPWRLLAHCAFFVMAHDVVDQIAEEIGRSAWDMDADEFQTVGSRLAWREAKKAADAPADVLLQELEKAFGKHALDL